LARTMVHGLSGVTYYLYYLQEFLRVKLLLFLRELVKKDFNFNLIEP